MLRTTLARGPTTPRHLVGFDPRRRPGLETEVLVIGGGIAGLSAALAAAHAGREVLLLCKGELQISNTAWAQGGVAAVLSTVERSAEDAVELHVRDTLAAGAGLCHEPAVRRIIGQAEAGMDFLRQAGCRFDAGNDGLPQLTREGGHSARRILHAHGDATGAEIARALVAAVRADPRVTIIEQAFAIDLLDRDGRIGGATYGHRDEVYAVRAGATILATGGCGMAWRETTNPPLATGDGLAMAYRAGAVLADLEFMQFHPTTLYVAGAGRLLVTEAMRGEGALLKNADGERFMPRYHPDAELAPRDVVTRAIVAEIRRTGFPHVWLDATHLGSSFLRERFPTIHLACSRFGIDIAQAWMPVHPSAHYHCGGVVSDASGRTTLSGLYAAGEVGCTGLHGANRLASNSLLEGVVVGLAAGAGAASDCLPPPLLRAEHRAPVVENLDVADLVGSLRSLMWRSVGIERSARDLAVARRSIAFWMGHQAGGFLRTPAGWELQNLLLVSSLIAQASEQRTASVGTHTRSDSVGDVADQHFALQREGLTP
ncbi:MAG TPA: L-aspartate oxidase [Planctomycetes bacterium]|nr:L-aspartate oxidase [Planctomycetota bacterium]